MLLKALALYCLLTLVGLAILLYGALLPKLISGADMLWVITGLILAVGAAPIFVTGIYYAIKFLALHKGQPKQ